MSNDTYITYQEVFGEKADKSFLTAIIASLNKKSSFCQLSMINNFLTLFPINLDKHKFIYIQGFLASNLFPRKFTSGYGDLLKACR
jgi:hypothetical protein